MPEETPGTPGMQDLAQALDALDTRIGQVQQTVDAATEARGRRTAAQERRTTVMGWWAAIAAAAAAVATAGAVAALVLLAGTIDDLHDQVLADCAGHRDWVELPAAAASAAAARTPGATPTVNSFVAQLAGNEAAAYGRKGCEGRLGPLPPVPRPAPAPPAPGG